MTRYREPSADQSALIADIHKRMSKRDRAPQLSNATVSIGEVLNILGAFRVFGDKGQLVVEMGTGSGFGGDVNWALYRSDGIPNPAPLADPYGGLGSTAILLYGPNAASQSLWLIGRKSDILLREDKTGKLADPEIGYSFTPSVNYSTPSVFTTSGSYAAQWTIFAVPQHAALRITVLVQTSDGSTGGNIRLHDPTSGTVFDAQSISLGLYGNMVLNATFPDFPGTIKYDVDVQRTAGAGSIRTQLLAAVGTGTP